TGGQSAHAGAHDQGPPHRQRHGDRPGGGAAARARGADGRLQDARASRGRARLHGEAPAGLPVCDGVSLTTARRLWDVVEPIAANVYFAPEAHRAYRELGFDGPSRVVRGIEFPNMVAYFTSRGACLGDGVSGHLVAAAFGVFKRPMVVAAVEEG